MTNPCCPGQCDFRVERVRQILAAIDVARATGVAPVVIARSVLNPRGERTMGRPGIDISNADEDAALEVIAVQQAMARLPKNATAAQIAYECCPHAVSKHDNTNEERLRNTGEPVSARHGSTTEESKAHTCAH